MNIPVVYEDEWLLAVNKPAGLLTIPTPKKEPRTLTSILNEDVKQRGQTYRLHPCHRLDRETSGVIVYAKGKSAQKKMMELFKDKKIKKTYLALVQGILHATRGTIDSPVDGLSAITSYTVIGRKKGYSIVEVNPTTGRKNQIRIHFKHIGHPLVGETKFAFRKDFPLRAKRVCLHARRLEFSHPFTHQHLCIDADLADDLKDFITKHERIS